MATFRTADDVEIRFEVLGDGPPVFVCQGGPNNICDTLIRDLAPLQDDFKLVFQDYRGSGKSGTAPVESYQFERLADDLDELRHHLGYESVSVLAHSMGGFVALQFALRHPRSVTRLALVGTTPCGAARPMAIPVLRALGGLRTAKAALMAARFLVLWSWRPASSARDEAMYAPMSVTQEARRELRATVGMAHPEVPVANDNASHLMKALGTLDLRDDLAAITCPVLVLYGTRDAVMVAGGEMLRAALPASELCVLPGVGHEPFIEAPPETMQTLRRFLT
ncbi:MAG: alpha/beta hydrolase [Actinomycetota bacterium]|nr:alpha/beta hydrolase [Actinomycetota bacterium]